MSRRVLLSEIVDGLANRASIPNRFAEDFVQAFFHVIEENLVREKLVKVKGLGTFKLIDVEARESIHVSTGERILLAGHTKVSFTPDPVLRDAVNRPFADFETVVLNEATPTELMERLDDVHVPETEEVAAPGLETIAKLASDVEATPEGQIASEDETLASVVEEVLEESVSDEQATVVEDAPMVEETSGTVEVVPEIEEPAAEESAVEESTVEESIAEEPAVEESTVEEPIAVEPAIEESTVEEPIEEESAVEESIVEEPAAEEPVVEESIVEEPAAEEPAVEESTVEEPVAEEPVVEESTVEEPALEEPIVEGSTETTSSHTPSTLASTSKHRDHYYYDEIQEETHMTRNIFLGLLAALLFMFLGYAICFYFRPFELPTLKPAPQSQRQFVPVSSSDDSALEMDDSSQPAELAEPATESTEKKATKTDAETSSPTTTEKTTTTQSSASASSYPQLEGGEYQIVGVKGSEVMKPGKTLLNISLKYYKSTDFVPYICKMNGIDNPDVVPLDMELKIPELKKK